MSHLLINYYEAASVILFGIGFMNLLLQNNLIKKFIGLNIMDTAISQAELLPFCQTASLMRIIISIRYQRVWC